MIGVLLATLVGRDAGGAAWTPADSNPRALFLPGGYSVTGTQGVDAVGTWVDASGNGHDLVSQGGVDAPEDVGGFPFFDNARSVWLYTAASIASAATDQPGDLGSAITGSVVVIYEPDLSEANGGLYYNAALISGDGATPTIAHTNDRSFRASAYDDVGYCDAYARSSGDLYADPIGETHVGVFTWATTPTPRLRCSVNGLAWYLDTPIDDHGGSYVISYPNVGGTMIGRNYSGGSYYHGRIKAMAFYAREITDDELAKWNTWALEQGLRVATSDLPSADPALLAWHRVGRGKDGGGFELSPTATLVSAITDLGPVGISLPNSPAYPNLFLADAGFGKRPTLGTTDGVDFAGVLIGDATAAGAPYAGAFTVYEVFRIPAGGGAPYYLRLNAGGSGVGLAAYITGGVGTMTTAADGLAFSVPDDTTVVAAFVYNGASSAVYLNSASTAASSGALNEISNANGNEFVSLSSGTYVGEESRYRWAERMIFNAAHDSTARAKWMGFLAARYGITLT